MKVSVSISLALLHFHVAWRTLCGFHGTLTHSTRRNATPGGVERPYACSHVGHSMNSPPRVPRARRRSYGISCRLAENAFTNPPPPSHFYSPRARSREYSNLWQISVTLQTLGRAYLVIIVSRIINIIPITSPKSSARWTSERMTLAIEIHFIG